MNQPIRVLIADDHPVMREGLRLFLQTQADIRVVGEAADGVEALEQVRQQHPDVLLLDIAMPRMDGLDAVRLIRETAPATRVVILTMYEKEAYIHQSLEAGALGYVPKGAPSDEILAAIRTAHRGRHYLSPRLHAEVIGAYLSRRQKEPRGGYELLSERERQVFRLLAEGNAPAQISDILCVSPRTVEKHRANIVKKLGISSPVEMLKYAVRIGVLDPDFWKT